MTNYIIHTKCDESDLGYQWIDSVSETRKRSITHLRAINCV